MTARNHLKAIVSSGALVLCAALAEPAARAQVRETIPHSVVEGDTIPLLAAEYYGDRNHGIFIMLVNGMEHERPLKPGESLKIPIDRDITAKVDDTIATLAEKYLGDSRRAKFLAEFNQLAPDASLAAGQVIKIPFHVRYKAKGKSSLREISLSLFATPKNAGMLKRYNFLDKEVLAAGDSIVIPIQHVQVRRSKMPPVDDPESQALMVKRREEQAHAADLLPKARAAWDAGDYATAKRELTRLDTVYLDVVQAVEVGVLLGSTYVAFGDKDSALATFKKALERSPGQALSRYDVSPKILEIWKQAGGKIVNRNP